VRAFTFQPALYYRGWNSDIVFIHPVSEEEKMTWIIVGVLVWVGCGLIALLIRALCGGYVIFADVLLLPIGGPVKLWLVVDTYGSEKLIWRKK
jgi:hypothetical protein